MLLSTLFETLKDNNVIYTMCNYIFWGQAYFGTCSWYSKLIWWKEYGFKDYILIENPCHVGLGGIIE